MVRWSNFAALPIGWGTHIVPYPCPSPCGGTYRWTTLLSMQPPLEGSKDLVRLGVRRHTKFSSRGFDADHSKGTAGGKKPLAVTSSFEIHDMILTFISEHVIDVFSPFFVLWHLLTCWALCAFHLVDALFLCAALLHSCFCG